MPHASVGLGSVGFYIPDGRKSIEAIRREERLDPQQEAVFNEVTAGMDEVPTAEGMDSADLAIQASKTALSRAELAPEDIDLLLVCQSRAPPHLMSSEATRVHHGLGLGPQRCMTIGGLGCVNICMALSAARDHLTAHPDANHVLIAAGSTPYGAHRYREAVTVCGDAGMGVVVSRQDDKRLIDIRYKVVGKFWDLWKVDFRQTNERAFREELTSRRRQFEMAVTTAGTFRALNDEILRENGVEDASAFVSQNLSLTAHGYQEQALDIALTASCDRNCARYGHLGDIDILLNLESSLQEGEIRPGDHVILMNASPVACWSSVLLRV